jgi:hypothetical protein
MRAALLHHAAPQWDRAREQLQQDVGAGAFKRASGTWAEDDIGAHPLPPPAPAVAAAAKAKEGGGWRERVAAGFSVNNW